MNLVKLSIFQFQQHSKLELHFQPGVNFITGPSGCGKSTILRAISWLCGIESYSDTTIRPDKASDKKRLDPTSVIGIFDNGIEFERIKSAGINRYKVRKPNCDELVYDSIGAKLPDDIRSILQMNPVVIDKESLDLNFAEQISLPFLYDKTGNFRLKLFNQLTGCDLLDKVTQQMNKDIFGYGRDIKVEQEFIETNTPKLNSVTLQIDELKVLYGNFQSVSLKLKDTINKLNTLKTLQTKIESNKQALLVVKHAINGIKIVPESVISGIKAKIDTYVALSGLLSRINDLNAKSDDVEICISQISIAPEESINKLKSMIEKWKNLSDLKQRYESNQKLLNEVKNAIGQIKIADLDTTSLRTKLERLTDFRKLFYSYNNSKEMLQKVNEEINKKQEEIKNNEIEISKLIQEGGVCSMCKQPITKEHLMNLH